MKKGILVCLGSLVVLAGCTRLPETSINTDSLELMEQVSLGINKEELVQTTQELIDLTCKTRSGEDRFANFAIIENREKYLNYLIAMAYDSSFLSQFEGEQCRSETNVKLRGPFLIFDSLSNLMGFETLTDPKVALETRTTAIFAMSKFMQDRYGERELWSQEETSLTFMRGSKLLYITDDTTLLERKGFSVEPELVDAFYTMLARQLNHPNVTLQRSAIGGLGSLQDPRAKSLLEAYVKSVPRKRSARAQLELQLNYGE